MGSRGAEERGSGGSALRQRSGQASLTDRRAAVRPFGSAQDRLRSPTGERGFGEQRSRGAGERGSRQSRYFSPHLLCPLSPLLLCPLSPLLLRPPAPLPMAGPSAPLLLCSLLLEFFRLIFVGINDFYFPGSSTKGAGFFPLDFGAAIPNFYISFPFTVMTFFVGSLVGSLVGNIFVCLGCVHIFIFKKPGFCGEYQELTG